MGTTCSCTSSALLQDGADKKRCHHPCNRYQRKCAITSANRSHLHSCKEHYEFTPCPNLCKHCPSLCGFLRDHTTAHLAVQYRNCVCVDHIVQIVDNEVDINH